MTKVSVKFLRNASDSYGNFEPQTSLSVGFDLRYISPDCNNLPITILPGKCLYIPTGIIIEPGEGLFGAIYPRSGFSTKKLTIMPNSIGVIDPDYRGELIVPLMNLSQSDVIIADGERIAQLIFHPVVMPTIEKVDMVSDTERGVGGLGHTGKI